MSKLFDQLKDAAREREGGLLMEALARKQESEAAPVRAELALPEAAAARIAAQAHASLPQGYASPGQPPASQGAAAVRVSSSSLAGLGLAAAIFLVALIAWHSTPWRAPPKLRIDPGTLKMDRSLDLDRPRGPDGGPSKGTTSGSRPS